MVQISYGFGFGGPFQPIAMLARMARIHQSEAL